MPSDKQRAYFNKIVIIFLVMAGMFWFMFSQDGLIRQAHAATRPHWDFPQQYTVEQTLDTADGAIKVWYPSSPSSTYEQMARDIRDVLDEHSIFTRFSELMQRKPLADGGLGGDDKLDIYIMRDMNQDGHTPKDGAAYPSSAYVMISDKLMNNHVRLRTSVAHEVFHAFQAAYKQHDGNDAWWGEATATWAEHYAYPSYNTEHERLKLFIPYPKTGLDAKADPFMHEYGAYIFAYYLTQNLGDSIIRKIYENCGSYFDCREAIDKTIPGGFKKHWREFTLWNYNKDPAKKYQDPGGTFPTISSIDSTHNKKLDIEKHDKSIEVDELEPLSAQLVTATNTVDANEVKKIVFEELGQFTSKLDGASIKAVIYFNDKAPAVEDWTDIDKRTFCIKCDSSNSPRCEEENFDRVVLIFANGHWQEFLPATEIKVVGKEPACRGKWVGTMTVTQTTDLSAPFVGSWQQKWTTVYEEELEEVEVGEFGKINPLAALNDTAIETEFHVMKQKISFDYVENHRGGPITGKGEVVRTHPHPGSRGSLINDDRELDTVVRFIKMKEFTGVQAVLGQGEYYFRDIEQVYGDCNFVNYSNKGMDCPKYSGGIFTSEDDLRGRKVEPGEDGTRFSGSKSFNDPIMNRIKTKIEWDYRLVSD